MKCGTCGVEIPEGRRSCAGCGATVDSGPGDTKLHAKAGATILSADAKVMESMGVTRIYQEKDLGKTLVYKPAEKRKPIFGWLVVIDGPDAWEEFRLSDQEGQLFLGKGDDCQLKLEDEKVEKLHASVRIKDDKLTITDLDTFSGTFVNGEAVTRTELKDGDTVTVGQSILRFRKC
jgi:hypothetical protein